MVLLGPKVTPKPLICLPRSPLTVEFLNITSELRKPSKVEVLLSALTTLEHF